MSRRARSGRRLRAERPRARCGSNPFHVARDFEGHTDRTIWSTAATLRHEGRRVAFTSTTGYVSWDTRDTTDLDYSPLPLVTRDNAEEGQAVHAGVPRRLGSERAGRACRTASGSPGRPASSCSPSTMPRTPPTRSGPRCCRRTSRLRSTSMRRCRHSTTAGVGLFGQGILTFGDAWDLTLGARVDRERKTARLQTFYEPAIAPPDAGRGRAHLRRRFAAGGAGLAICGRPIRSTCRPGAASRPAASTRRRRRGASPTARSTPGTSRAA